MESAFAQRKEIAANLKKIGYLWVSLDLSGLRSGSLNDQLGSTISIKANPETGPDMADSQTRGN